ncbi:MAG: helix-turn-helix transcriptional regulator [Chloroflexota bacterium]
MADDSRQVIVERVVAARKEAGLNQSQLAKQMGAGKTTIQRYEDIESVPSAWERLRDMGEILKRTPGYLIGASDIPWLSDKDEKLLSWFQSLDIYAQSLFLDFAETFLILDEEGRQEIIEAAKELSLLNTEEAKETALRNAAMDLAAKFADGELASHILNAIEQFYVERVNNTE